MIRNSRGEVLKAGADHIPFAMDAFQTEVIAAWEAIRSAVSMGMAHGILETDAVLVVGNGRLYLRAKVYGDIKFCLFFG